MFHPLFLSSPRPETNVDELCRKIYENPDLYRGGIQLELLNKVSRVSISIFALTVGIAIVQYTYFPMNKNFERAIGFTLISSLLITTLSEETKNFENLMIEVLTSNSTYK